MSGPLPDGDTLGLGLEHTPCIVLGQGASTPALERLLRERGFEPSVVDDPWLAMAELCLREREQAAHATWGLDAGGRLALVIDEPRAAAWPERVRNELIDAVRWYLPGVSVWRFTGTALVAVAAADAPSPRAAGAVGTRRVPPGPLPAEPAAEAAAPPAAEPRLRLAGEPAPRPPSVRSADDDAREGAESEERAPEAPTVSREEIDMLLGRAPRQERRPKA